MPDTYRVVATHCALTKPDVYTQSSESFATMEEAVAWMNGGAGENFAAACTIDTNGCDEQLVGYWLDEVEVWSQAEIDALPEKPGVQVPIDDEPEPVVEPVSEPEQEWHTYASHLQFSARDDEHARAISRAIVEQITLWQRLYDAESSEPLMILPQGYAIEAAHLTDADDWAETLDTGEDVCYQCGEAGGTNRLRVGGGTRWCQPCIDKTPGRSVYKIEDVLI